MLRANTWSKCGLFLHSDPFERGYCKCNQFGCSSRMIVQRAMHAPGWYIRMAFRRPLRATARFINMSLARQETLQILFPRSTSPTVEEMLAKMQEPPNPCSPPYQPPKELSVIEEAAFVPLPNIHPWAIELPEDDKQHLKKTSKEEASASQGFMWLAKRVAEDGGVKKARPVPRKDSSLLKLKKSSSNKSIVARAMRANRER